MRKYGFDTGLILYGRLESPVELEVLLCRLVPDGPSLSFLLNCLEFTSGFRQSISRTGKRTDLLRHQSVFRASKTLTKSPNGEPTGPRVVNRTDSEWTFYHSGGGGNTPTTPLVPITYNS